MELMEKIGNLSSKVEKILEESVALKDENNNLKSRVGILEAEIQHLKNEREDIAGKIERIISSLP